MTTHPRDRVREALPTLADDADALVRHTSLPLERWTDAAACVDAPLNLFFPPRGVQPAEAIVNYCATCPVRLDCLAYGLLAPRFPGLLGGRTHNQREQLRKVIG